MRKATSTNLENEKRLEDTCGLTYAMILTKGRWTINIIWSIYQGKNRYSSIRKDIEGISEKMLTQRLNELEEVGLVYKNFCDGSPPRTEYSLSPSGIAFIPVIDALCDWGNKVRPHTKTLV